MNTSPASMNAPADMIDYLFGGNPLIPVKIMGVNVDEWVDILATSVSFAASRNGTYNILFYATCIHSIVDNLNDGDLMKFLHGNMDVGNILSNMHDSLCVMYRKYKSHCLRVNRKGKALCEDRDDWYSMDYDCLPEDVQMQYMEIVHVSMHKMVELSLAQSFSSL
jgi:hypothetical protein